MRRLVVVGPLPPPLHGVTVSTALVLESPPLARRFAVEHLDTSDHRPGVVLGRWDLTNVRLALAAAVRLLRTTRGEPGVLYLPLSQGRGGFVRDSLLVLIATRRRWRVAAHLRGGEFDAFYAQAGRGLKAWIRLTLRRVDSVAVLGSSLRLTFAGLVPPERIAVVPNGTPDIGPNGLTRRDDLVVFLSNLRWRKGVAEALEAALLVLERRPETSFVFAGEWEDDELEGTLRRRAEGAGERIRFLPPVTGETKHSLLLHASVLLFTPREPEGHPRVVLEAMAAGLPIVTTNRGAIATTVIDGETGYVLPDPNPDALARRVLDVLGDPDLRERMSRATRARYLAEFTQERADIRLADWLEGLAR